MQRKKERKKCTNTTMNIQTVKRMKQTDTPPKKKRIDGNDERMFRGKLNKTADEQTIPKTKLMSEMWPSVIFTFDKMENVMIFWGEKIEKFKLFLAVTLHLVFQRFEFDRKLCTIFPQILSAFALSISSSFFRGVIIGSTQIKMKKKMKYRDNKKYCRENYNKYITWIKIADRMNTQRVCNILILFCLKLNLWTEMRKKTTTKITWYTYFVCIQNRNRFQMTNFCFIKIVKTRRT